jgi:hypothetical protein
MSEIVWSLAQIVCEALILRCQHQQPRCSRAQSTQHKKGSKLGLNISGYSRKTDKGSAPLSRAACRDLSRAVCVMQIHSTMTCSSNLSHWSSYVRILFFGSKLQTSARKRYSPKTAIINPQRHCMGSTKRFEVIGREYRMAADSVYYKWEVPD